MKSWILFFSLLVISYQGYTQNLVVNIGVTIYTLADPCDGPIMLDAKNPGHGPGFQYQWNTGEKTPQIIVTKNNVYTVIVTDPANPSRIGYDTSKVTFAGAFDINLGKDTFSLCAGCITLDAANSFTGSTYEWSNGETTQKINACKSGFVSVKVTNSFGCVARDTIFLNIIGKESYTFNPSPDVNVCGNSTVTLKSGLTKGVGKFRWSRGNETATIAETESINVTTSGKYVVKIYDLEIVCLNGSKQDTIIDTINVNINNPIVNLGPDQSKCGGCVTLSAGAQPPGSTFLWSTGSRENSITVCTPGLNNISLTVNGPDNCSSKDDIIVDIKDNFTLDLVNEVLECASTHTITAPTYAAKYLWNTGQTTPSITVSNSGTYKVKIYDFVSGCAVTDTLTDQTTITFVAKLPTPGVITEKSGPCTDKKFSIIPIEGVTNYIWSVPAGWTITGQGQTEITVQVPTGVTSGTVSVKSSNANNFCRSDSSSIVTEVKNFDIVRYNSFTPNNDGTNDLWVVKNINFYPENNLVILNRWGNEVYKKQNYNNEWDGSGLNEGTYFYKLNLVQCGQAKEFTGNVTIVR